MFVTRFSLAPVEAGESRFQRWRLKKGGASSPKPTGYTHMITLRTKADRDQNVSRAAQAGIPKGGLSNQHRVPSTGKATGRKGCLKNTEELAKNITGNTYWSAAERSSQGWHHFERLFLKVVESK
eukprot:6053542-Amphidinium_carterae.1